MCNLIEDQDGDGLIKLTLDYPQNKDSYIPFLNMEVKANSDEGIDTRLYRKPQKKLLTLNSKSHRPTLTKLNTVSNMYKTAVEVSSNNLTTVMKYTQLNWLMNYC